MGNAWEREAVSGAAAEKRRGKRQGEGVAAFAIALNGSASHRKCGAAICVEWRRNCFDEQGICTERSGSGIAKLGEKTSSEGMAGQGRAFIGNGRAKRSGVKEMISKGWNCTEGQNETRIFLDYRLLYR